jgi:hypothetical protein
VVSWSGVSSSTGNGASLTISAPGEYTISATASDGRGGSATAWATFYGIAVSVDVAPSQVVPGGTATVAATVSGLPPGINRPISFQAREVLYSGGHQHIGRPLGNITPSSGTINSSFTATYGATTISGSIVIEAYTPTDVGDIVAETVIDILVDNLFPLSSGVGYALVGSTAEHPANHYGTAGFVAALQNVGTDFASAYPSIQLRYNDMSLVWGGLFDCGSSCNGTWWNTPHSEHRNGTNMDLSFDCLENGSRRRLRESERDQLMEILAQNHVYIGFTHSDHWHLVY